MKLPSGTARQNRSRGRDGELQDARRLLDRTLAALADAVFVVDARSRVITACNPAVRDVFGYEPDEVIGRNTELLHVDRAHYRRFGRALYPALDATGVFRTRFEVRHRDGRRFVSEHTVTEIRDERGERQALVSVVRDVTAAQRAETQVATQRDLLIYTSAARDLPSTLFLCLEAAIGISGLDAGGIYLVEPDGGLRLAHASGLSDDFLAVAGSYPSGTAHARLVRRGAPAYFGKAVKDLPLCRRERREALRALAVLPFSAGGEITGCLNLASHTRPDVPTAVRAAVEAIAQLIGLILARAQADAALRESEERFRSLVRSSLDAVLLTAPDGRTLAANAAACRMFGRTETELLRLGRGGVVDPTDPRLVRALEQRARTGRFSGELRFLRADGTSFPGELSSVAFTDSRGETLTSVVIRDLSEQVAARRRIEEQQAALARVERAARASEIAAWLAHELNQPLTGLLSGAQAARRILAGPSPDLARVRSALDDLVADSRRAAGFVASLRELQREGRPARRVVSLEEIVRDALRLDRPGREADAPAVRVRLGRDLPPVCVDPVQIQHVLLNLLLNARQAAGPTPGAARITLAATHRPGRGVRVTVADQGPGIALDERRRVFEPSVTTRPDGLGLGLAICRSLVEANGGRIWAEPRRGGGTRLCVELPAAAEEAR